MENDSIKSSGSVVISAQYIKDLSFENPRSPHSLISRDEPSIELTLDINAQAIHENTFEVILTIRADATVEKERIFLVDLHYGGLFVINEDFQSFDLDKELILLVHCPNIIFPYARRIISDITRDGGYPPLMLAPVDFMGLYKKKKANGVS